MADALETDRAITQARKALDHDRDEPVDEWSAFLTPFEIDGIAVVPFAQDHGFSTTLGFRIGDFGYSTDVTELDDETTPVEEEQA